MGIHVDIAVLFRTKALVQLPNSPLLFPLSDQVFVRKPLFHRKVVQLFGDGFSFIEEVV